MMTGLGKAMVLGWVAACCLSFPALGRTQTDLAGWERGGAYDRHYKPEAVTTVAGTFVDIKEAAPMPGMAPGPVVTIRTKTGTLIAVQAGPSAFAHFLAYALGAGDRVKIKGAYAEFGGGKILMAAKIRVNEVYEFKCRRTRDGAPYWSLPKDALILEKLEK